MIEAEVYDILGPQLCTAPPVLTIKGYFDENWDENSALFWKDWHKLLREAEDREALRLASPESKSKRYSTLRRDRMKANGGSHTSDDIASIFTAQNGACAGCLEPLTGRFHCDHILPVCLGGSDSISNLQLLCVHCNQKKGKMHPDVWFQLVTVIRSRCSRGAK